MRAHKHRWIWLALFVIPLTLLGSRESRGDEDEEERQAQQPVRIYQIGGLVFGRTNFWRELEPVVGPDDVSDEMWPLFGGESEEPLWPVGMADELIELIRHNVEVHQGIAAYLTALERSINTAVTFDVQCVRLDTTQSRQLFTEGALVLDPETAAALLSGPGAGPAVSFTAYAGQRAHAFGGTQMAYLQDHDTEVAQKSNTADPIIGIANLGLAVDAIAVLDGSGGTVMCSLNAAVSRVGEMRTVETARTGPLQTPRFVVGGVRTVLRAPVGAWCLADGRVSAQGEDDWMFLLRVRTTPQRRVRGRARTVEVPAAAVGDPGGAWSTRMYPVHDLNAAAYSRTGSVPILVPSNYTPPEPPELPEPAPTFAADYLVELFRLGIGHEEDWEDPASIEVRNGLLYVRNRAGLHEAIERTLAELRRQLLWTLVVDAELLQVDRATMAQLGDVTVLDEAQHGALREARAAGSALLRDAGRLTSFRGTRNTVESGDRVIWLQDYEVNIAEESDIGNPVVQEVLSGLVLDVSAGLASDGGSVAMEVRFTRTNVLKPFRRLNTLHGDVELPEMQVLRYRAATHAPLGETVVAASWREGPNRILLLLTPRLH
ncbi:MAG: hypothetical protein ACYTG6_16595 [Planctomycetota bacterium]|jgi:hypothetical protein